MGKNQPQAVAEVIRLRREEKGLSREKLAKEIGVSPETVKSWEQRGTKPRLQVVGRLASALGIAVETLTGTQPNLTDELPRSEQIRAAKKLIDSLEPALRGIQEALRVAAGEEEEA